jgi:hypothetical protein
VLASVISGPTAGRYYIDITRESTLKNFTRSECFVGAAVLAGIVWVLAIQPGAGPRLAVCIAFVVGFAFRLIALFLGWEEPMSKEPKGLVMHKDAVLLVPKLAGMSEHELRDLWSARVHQPGAATH